MGGGEDPELEEIRRRKLAEIQQQQEHQEQAMRQADMVDAQRQQILRGILTPEARERLGRLKIAYPDIASQVEDRIIMLAQSGRLNSMIDDATLKEILSLIAPSKREITIQRK
ncbi:MAG: DNA-binding protein [Thermoplasmata archaeon]|nr:DNA-binding protein [Thermoplasmata archaeon]MCK5414165.1 DNA-binding protein [Thermoplasmata archaeon]